MKRLLCFFGLHERGPWVRRQAYRDMPALECRFDPVTMRSELVTVNRRHYAMRVDHGDCENCGKVLVTNPLSDDWHWA